MKKALMILVNLIVILLTGKDDNCVDENVCDYSGEGRDRYGR